MEMIRRIYKQSAFILILLAVLSAFIEWRKFPLSIIIGGVLALANLKGIAWGVGGLIGTQKAIIKLVLFSLVRLFIVFAILITLILLNLINIIGVFAGFTLVLAILLKEGFRSARENA